MNKRFFSILAIMAILLSVANLWLLLRGSAGAAGVMSGSVPQQISYQARLSDAEGNPLNGNFDMRFCLYAASTGGTALWCETYAGVNGTAISVTDGVLSVLLGSINPLSQTLFDGAALYVGVKVNTDQEMSPRRAIVQVPYAYWAAQAETADDADTVDGRHANYFATANHAHSALAAPDGDPQEALYVDDAGNVSVGATGSDATFHVNGSIEYAAIKRVDLATSTYNVQVKRYVVEATKAQVRNTVPLDMPVVNQLCKDEDGCTITLGMKDWADTRPGQIASRGPYRFFMSQTSHWWRLSSDTEGLDGNGSAQHILHAWDCYFTDAEYAQGTSTDSAVQLGLLNWNSAYNDPDMVCILTIDD